MLGFAQGKVNELLAKNNVHQYTKNYFTGE